MPRKPDIKKDRFMLVHGGSAQGYANVCNPALVRPAIPMDYNYPGQWFEILPDPVIPPSIAARTDLIYYPRSTGFGVVCAPYVGTVDEHVALFREAMERIFTSLYQLDDEKVTEDSETAKRRWGWNEQFQAKLQADHPDGWPEGKARCFDFVKSTDEKAKAFDKAQGDLDALHAGARFEADGEGPGKIILAICKSAGSVQKGCDILKALTENTERFSPWFGRLHHILCYWMKERMPGKFMEGLASDLKPAQVHPSQPSGFYVANSEPH